MVFRDRVDAGRRLAERLRRYQAGEPVVVGLPRGGVPVAAEVARALGAPLDVMVARKLGCPWQPELGVGAIAEGGVTVVNDDLVAAAGLRPDEVDEVARQERAELELRVRRYRAGRPPLPLGGRTVLLVDDGLATGFTARAAVRALRRLGAARVVLAVPVAPASTVAELGRLADEVVALEVPPGFHAVGQYYADFAPTSDQEVAALLAGEPVAAASAGGDSSRMALEDPSRACRIDLGDMRLDGDLALPERPATGVVVFAHGSGSSRHSPRNRAVARSLNRGGLATLLLDLLAPEEEAVRANVFDVELLAGRLLAATRWLRAQPEAQGLALGYFGASTGAAAALWAAAKPGNPVAAVVCRGGRPDLAATRLGRVRAPTLLIVGGRDPRVHALNRWALGRLRCERALEVVPGATHLFEEPGALGRVAALAESWFAGHLIRPALGAQAGASAPALR